MEEPLSSPELPLVGECLCGQVRFEVTAPFISAGYCHCINCQRRSGTAAAGNARLPRAALRVVSGRELLRSYQPEGGNPKWSCSHCGAGLFAGDLDAGEQLGIRLGAFVDDPGIRPQYRAYVASAAVWDTIPDDDLPRYDGPRTA